MTASTTATRRQPPVQWIALADGLAHAQPARGQKRTFCGKPRIDLRYAHPATGRCPRCEMVLNGTMVVAAPR